MASLLVLFFTVGFCAHDQEWVVGSVKLVLPLWIRRTDAAQAAHVHAQQSQLFVHACAVLYFLLVFYAAGRCRQVIVGNMSNTCLI